MGIKLIGVAVLVVYGAMLADVVRHGDQAASVTRSLGEVWNQSIKTVAGG